LPRIKKIILKKCKVSSCFDKIIIVLKYKENLTAHKYTQSFTWAGSWNVRRRWAARKKIM